MTEYALYLESGPKHKKTMVHVLDLLGCIAQGPTTEAAVDATPEAVRTFLDFLRDHGEAITPHSDITTRVAVHVTEGVWLGYGDPTPIPPDFEPLAAKDLAIYLGRLDWLQADLLDLVKDLPLERLLAEPENGGRSLYHMLQHMAESQAVYLRYLVGKLDRLSDALRVVQKEPPEVLFPALIDLWQVIGERLGELTEAERQVAVPHGQVTWTARRTLRRMLEHAWEHRMEISARLKNSNS